jgi:hypothetical protein
MILSKASKLTLLAGLLCLLLMGFTGASYASIRWDVYASPTEVITTGRSEVLGSISLYVQTGQGTVVTGNSWGGPTQIGIWYQQGVQIDSELGVRVYAPKFSSGSPITYLPLQNLNIIPTPTRCSGFVTLNIPPGVVLVDGDVIRLDGIRGRIDMSDGRSPGTNLYAQMQSINDPAANIFYPETVRVATSFPGLVVTNVVSDTASLCLQPFGKDQNLMPGYYIEITEGFVRAFVAKDSNTPGPDLTDRVDSGQQFLGQADYTTATNTGWYSRAIGTRIQVVLNSIPASVTAVTWPPVVPALGGGFSDLRIVSGTSAFQAGTVGGTANGWAYCTYEYFSQNQAGLSDTTLESFRVSPWLTLSMTNQADAGNVLVGASLTGAFDTHSGCDLPAANTTRVQPRFIIEYHSYKNGAETPVTTDRLSTTFGIYGAFSPCTCYLLFPYITSDMGITPPEGGLNWDTGISVSNTSDDAAVFGTKGAAWQSGKVYFYLYDKNLGYVGAPVTTVTNVLYGRSYVTLASQILAQVADVPGYPTPAVTPFAYVSNGGFHGYMIVRTDFQYCHGYAFVSDIHFNTISQGYVANVIPDPAVKGGKRTASAAADVMFLIPAGESLNN